MKLSSFRRPVSHGRRRARGFTLLEVLIAGALSTVVMSIAIGVYVSGTRTFHSEQAQNFVQFRARTSLDNIAKEVRAAKELRSSYGSWIASTGVLLPACIIMRLPAQSSTDKTIFFHGASSSTPYGMATDLVIYRHNTSTNRLLRTVIPAQNVLCDDGVTRTSFRAAAVNEVVATNIAQMRFVFRDRDGTPISVSTIHRTAAVDIQATVESQNASGATGAVASVGLSGVRLRNMRSGSIPGVVTAAGGPLANAQVQAIYTSTSGAYSPGSILGEATTDSTGNFEVYGLEPGTYTVKATAPSGASLSVTAVDVPEEGASASVTVALT